MEGGTVKIAAFPKGFLDDIVAGRMTLFEWIDLARGLDCEGLELYDGFLTSLDTAYLDTVRSALGEAGFAMPMLCCSPDFTQADPDAREREIERWVELIRVARYLGGPGVRCRVLSGQRYPDVPVEQGLEWVADAINRLVPVAREHDVVLALENHYKDGHWRYPEFAQRQDVFLRLLALIPEREHFGVQYDPSNAIVAGDDPIALLRAVADRVVSMHASDRFLAPGASLDDLRQSDGTLSYSPLLQHGVIGRGLNDYDQIFSILRAAGYDGWVSIEDGVNGLDEMAESLAFLHRQRERHFGPP
jgi:sugar phosphate isomerase/epimerase